MRNLFCHAKFTSDSDVRAQGGTPNPINQHEGSTGTSMRGHASLALAASTLMAFCLVAISILITRALGVEGRGEVAAAVLLPTILGFVGQMGLPTAVAYWISTKPAQRDTIIGTARTISACLSAFLVLLSVLLSWLLPIDERVSTPAIIFSLFIPIHIFLAIDTAIIQADLRPFALNGVRVSASLAYLAVVALIMVLDIESTLTMVLAQLFGLLCGYVLASEFAGTRRQFAFRSDIARSLISYGGRAHLGTVQPVETLRIDQLILSFFLSTHALGTYVIAMTFVTANRMVGVSFGLVAFPTASRGALTPGVNLLLRKMIGAATLLALTAAALQIVTGRILLEGLFGVTSDEAYNVMVLMVVASAFMSVKQVLSDILRGFGRPGVPAFAELILAITLVSCSLVLWSYELLGVSLAMLISVALSLLFISLSFLPSSHVMMTNRIRKCRKADGNDNDVYI